MCELLGLAFNRPVVSSLSFRGFRHRSKSNPDGWGVATFPDGRATVIKEPLQATISQVAETVVDENNDSLRSKIVIGHVRKKSAGEPSFENTHPFQREFRGHDVVFAHNGTLGKEPLRVALAGRFTPTGQTDSELAFCALLEWMDRDAVGWSEFERIDDRLQELNGLGTMNLLFSEGEHLFAYHDRNGHAGLCQLRRKAPFCSVTLEDEEWSVDLAARKPADERGYVIATSNLTDETWTSFAKGQLIVFREGEIVYQGEPKLGK